MAPEEKPLTNFRRPAVFGLSMLLVLFGGSVAWSYFAELAGAVIAQGTVAIQGKPKTIQHAEGGVVEVINVAAGDRVKKGDVLIELDDTNLVANLAIYRGRLRDSLVQRSRLLAELDEKTTFDPPTEDEIRDFGLVDIGSAMEQQRILMQARRQTRDGEIAQFDEKVEQLNNQIQGNRGLREETLNQVEIYRQEQAAISKLIEQQLAARNQLLVFDRSMSDLRGRIAEQEAEMARLENSIAEAKVARGQVDRQMRERSITELEEVEAKIDEMKQQITATALQLKRMSIRAPVDGIIHELAMHTIGGVIQPGQAIMQIVPDDDNLEIEVNADTRSVDVIAPKQQAVLRFPAFHSRTTPEIFGEVIKISPSSVVDERTGAAFYRVLISVTPEEKAKLGNDQLIPGMPVEAVIPTDDRTVLSYLIKPLADQLSHALREE